MAQLKIRNLSPLLGAEVEGFDPQAELDEETRRVLKGAFDDRSVLVFRGIEIDHATQLFLVETLHGDEPADRAAAPTKEPGHVSNKEPDGGAPYGRLLFHSDMMWSDLATQVPSLYALEAEQPSVPTVFASTTRAWDTLPDDLRARVAALHARHESGHQGRGDHEYEAELLQPQWNELRSTVTPVAQRHPRIGRTMLYVCEQQTREIVELPKLESDELLDALFAHLYNPEHLLEHHWRTGDLVAWDNQAVQHARPYLYADGPARTLRKVHAPRDLVARTGTPTYDRTN